MKLIKKSLISILFCMLIFSEVCIAFNLENNRVLKHHKSHTKNHRKNKIHNSQIPSKIEISKEGKWANFAEGLLMGMANNNNGWKVCLPEKWKKTFVASEADDFLERKAAQFQESGTTLVQKSGMISTVLCKVRQVFITIMGLLSKLTPVLDKRKMFFIEGRMIRSRNGRKKKIKRGLFDILEGVVSGVGYGIAVGAKGIADGTVYAAKGVAQSTAIAAQGVADGTVYAAKGVAQGTVAAAQGVADGTVYAAKGVAYGTVAAAQGVADGTVYTAKGVADGTVYAAKGIASGTVAATNAVVGAIDWTADKIG
jgi:hypothetical protein